MRRVIGVILILLAYGCGGAPGLSSADMSWSRAHGGLVCHRELPQLQAAADRLADSAGLHAVRVHVLDTQRPVAYARPTDEVFVSVGLIERLPGDQVRAAIAHEIGHLAMHHGGSDVLGLAGMNDPADEEMMADRVGAELLHRSGADAGAMVRMLETMRDQPWANESTRELFVRRVEQFKM